ncbi:hypothetical protein SAFG77S_10146 [Streptomyces afghaniensis]
MILSNKDNFIVFTPLSIFDLVMVKKDKYILLVLLRLVLEKVPVI